jgi:TatD DNase family protein
VYVGAVLFDSHNHLQSEKFATDAQKLFSQMKSAGIRGCVVNATKESDWKRIGELAKVSPDFVRPAYGIHPWFADTAEEGWEGRLRGILEGDSRATVGETGVDGWVDSPEMDIQREVFKKQVEIAAEMDRVMTVHCLKAWEELFEVMDEVAEWPAKFLMHSFGGTIELAERLMKHDGVMFSFSGYFLHERKQNVLDVFKKLPKDRILLETDAPEMMPPDEFIDFPLEENVNHPANLGKIADELGRQIGTGALGIIEENERVFWGI